MKATSLQLVEKLWMADASKLAINDALEISFIDESSSLLLMGLRTVLNAPLILSTKTFSFDDLAAEAQQVFHKSPNLSNNWLVEPLIS